MTVYTIFGLVGAAAFLLTLIRYFTARPSNLLITYLQYFVGSLFIFSGFVKAVDPLGTGYKMHEYFEAFAAEGLRPFWEWIGQFSTFFAIVMIALELFIGFMLLIGWKPRFTVTIIWWLTLFFTFLTGYTYLSGYGITKLFILLSAGALTLFAVAALPHKQSRRYNITFLSLGVLIVLFLLVKFTGWFFTIEFTETKMKVTDCGCFGDFIKLKPWETFYKDVVLDVMILMLVLSVKHVRPVFTDTARTGIAFVTGIASLVFCLYNVYMNEPMIDFRPYKVGNDVVELRKEKVPAKIEMLFVYKNKNTGEVKEYGMNDLAGLNYDELEFVERKDKVLDPGIPAKITNLRIENDEGADITDDLLSDENYSMMVVSYNLKKSNKSAFKQLNEIAKACEKAGVNFYAVTTNDGKVEAFRHEHQTAYPFYHADETPLKTIIRSNPGLVLFKKGVVVNKWHYRHLPSAVELNNAYFKK
ncbi:MAG: DoxX family membrane protein [Chitinophagales bacterium]|nr:DoxX family membrane protein [Chitinophagales bacterium]